MNTKSNKKNRVHLIFLIVFLLSIISVPVSYALEKEVILISPQEARELIQKHQLDSDFIILDLRSKDQWEEERIKNALSYQDLLPDEPEEKLTLEPQATYLFYSQGNLEKEEVIKIMDDSNIPLAYVLSGGIKAWLEEGLLTVFFKTIEPSDAQQLIIENQGNSNFVIIDLRDENERMTHRKIENSINMPLANESFLEDLKKLDREKTYLIYCKKGVNSLKVLRDMRDHDFMHVYSIKGGFENWTSKKMPTVR